MINYIKQIFLLGILLTNSLAFAQTVQYKLEEFVTELDHPWALAYLPDGKILLSERSGNFKIIDTNGKVSKALAGTPDVVFRGQGGLADVIIDPDYIENGKIYFSYSARDANQNNKLTLFVASAKLSGLKLTDVTTIFIAKAPRRPSVHYGAKLALLPDGTLAIASGDGFDYRDQAQKLDNHFGKIIRITTNGKVPSDNPFLDVPGALPEIYSYGHRNPQGLIVNDKGELIESEHGPRGGDEMNVIQPGVNYGWPAITYGLDYSGAYISPYTSYPGMEQPLHYWTPSIAPSGIMQYTGNLFPAWKGSYFNSALVSQDVKKLSKGKGDSFQAETVFFEAKARIRNIYQAPNGEILLVTDGSNGKLIKVTKN